MLAWGGCNPSDMAEEPAAGPSKRLGKLTTANMLRSLLPLLVMVLALAYFCSPHDLDPVTEIDPSGTISFAASLSERPLLIPVLAETWRPTSVNLADQPADQPGDQPGPITLTIGYVTPTGEFARYVVSTDPASATIADLLAGAETVGVSSFAGREWDQSTSTRGEPLYTRTDGDLRLLMTGSASREEFRELAGSLAAYSG